MKIPQHNALREAIRPLLDAGPSFLTPSVSEALELQDALTALSPNLRRVLMYALQDAIDDGENTLQRGDWT